MTATAGLCTELTFEKNHDFFSCNVETRLGWAWANVNVGRKIRKTIVVTQEERAVV